MAITQISILGAIVAILGMAFKAGPLIGAGAIIFFTGLFIAGSFIKIPGIVLFFIILLIIFIIGGRRK